MKPAKKTKPTHRITLYRHNRKPGRLRWDWNVERIENGEQICFSNQGHSRLADCIGTIAAFLTAAKRDRVEVVSTQPAPKAKKGQRK